MKISLVLATVGRTEELARFLEHLDRQSHREFELIIVDQNSEGFLDEVLAPFHDRIRMLHLHSPKGLSRARNVGLRYATGELICFPDDDCWYPQDTLEQISDWFARHPEGDVLSGQCVDELGANIMGRKDTVPRWLNKYTVCQYCISVTLVLRRRVVEHIGAFNEQLGAGAPMFSSSEETDYVLRALRAGMNIYHCPSIWIHHPRTVLSYDTRGLQRAYDSGRDLSWVLRLNGFSFWYVAYFWERALLAAVLALLRMNVPKARYHSELLRGRIHGWFA